jgi:hypothetical protein
MGAATGSNHWRHWTASSEYQGLEKWASSKLMRKRPTNIKEIEGKTLESPSEMYRGMQPPGTGENELRLVKVS